MLANNAKTKQNKGKPNMATKTTPFDFAAQVVSLDTSVPYAVRIAVRIANLIFRDVEALAALVNSGQKIDWQRQFNKPYKPNMACFVANRLHDTDPDVCARVMRELGDAEGRAQAFMRARTKGRPLSQYHNATTATPAASTTPTTNATTATPTTSATSATTATPAASTTTATPTTSATSATTATTAASTTTATPTTEAAQLAALIAKLGGAGLDREAVAAIASDVAERAVSVAMADMVQPTRVEVVRTLPSGEKTTHTRVAHKQYAALLALTQVRDASGYTYPIWLPGPSGSGKTTACMHAAQDMGLAFHHNGAVDGDYRLLGMLSVLGKYIRTAFREAYEHGGVYLFDEVDASHPSALAALNAALENGHCAFPDATIARHPDCIILAAANTYGQGATHDYVGRVKIDAATIDRFLMLDWGYDESLETALSGNPQWSAKVQAWRHAAASAGVKHIISPRASIRGAALLAAGIPEKGVVDMVVRKGLDATAWGRIAA